MSNIRKNIIVEAAMLRRSSLTKTLLFVPSMFFLWIVINLILVLMQQADYMISGTTANYKIIESYVKILSAIGFLYALASIRQFNFSDNLSVLESHIVSDHASNLPQILDDIATIDNTEVSQIAESIVEAHAVNIETYLDKFKNGRIDNIESAVERTCLVHNRNNTVLQKVFDNHTVYLPHLNNFMGNDVGKFNMLLHQFFSFPSYTPRFDMKLSESQTEQCQRLDSEIKAFRARTGTRLKLVD